jgi:protein CpxP
MEQTHLGRRFMTKTLGLYFAAGLLAVVATAAVPLLATGQQGPPPGGGPMGRGGPMGPGGPGMRGPGGPIPPGIELTDDQRQQVRSIMESHRDQMQQAGEKMRTAREGMQALIDADTLDESAIRAKSVEVAAAEADAAIMQAKVRAEVFQILTPEQQQKAKEFRESHQGPGGRGGPGARPRQPGHGHQH